jgi:phosphoglycolate phosphatase
VFRNKVAEPNLSQESSMALICFDLDGTLVDPLQAMNHCVRLTCEDFGLPCPSTAQVASRIGLGAEELFAGLAEPGRMAAILECYWQHFAEEGIVQHRIYDGTLLMLNRLKHQGHQLYVVTVKPARYAKQVLHQFDLLLAFEDVFGGDLNAPGRPKGEVVALLRERGILQPGGFMIGDRAEDMAAATAHGLIPMGVTYGFGSAGELKEAGAGLLFDSVTALDDWFKEKLHEPEILDSFSRSE